MTTKHSEIIETVREKTNWEFEKWQENNNEAHVDGIDLYLRDLKLILQIQAEEIFEDLKKSPIHNDHDAFCNKIDGLCEKLVFLKKKWVGDW